MNLSDHILFEDDYIIVLNKPHGLMVEPDRNGHINLQQEVKKYLKRTLALQGEVYAQHLHRLDRPVSGVILFAKQKSVLKNLSEQFATRAVKKRYEAMTSAAPRLLQGSLQHWLRKEKKKAILYQESIEYSELARLDYEVTTLSKDRFLWEIDLHTGKYHQIRAQLSSTGCPIVGDSLYGSEIPFRSNAVALHASMLVFRHPVSGDEMTMTAERDF